MFPQKDADILSGRPIANMGGWYSLLVGRGDFGVWRSLLDFDLSNINGELQRATLSLSLDHYRRNHIPFTSTVHIITSDWGEGNGNFQNATNGDSSWFYSKYPTLWTTPGGDFQSSSMGFPIRSENSQNVITFELDIDILKPMLINPSRFHGLLIKDDENPGLADYESRECLGNSQQSACSRGQRPMLILELTDNVAPGLTQRPTTAPTRAPTRQPTKQPTRGPTRQPTKMPTRTPTRAPTRTPTKAPTRQPAARTLQPAESEDTPYPSSSPTFDATRSTDAPVVATLTSLDDSTAPTPHPRITPFPTDELAYCEMFAQTILIPLKPVEWKTTFESSVTNMASLYTQTRVTTRVVDMQPEAQPLDTWKIIYQVCFSDFDPSYPQKHVEFMANTNNRRLFEEDLLARGMPVQRYSISSVVWLDSTVGAQSARTNEGSSKKSMTTLIVVMIIMALVAILALVWVVCRRRKQKVIKDLEEGDHTTNSNSVVGVTAFMEEAREAAARPTSPEPVQVAPVMATIVAYEEDTNPRLDPRNLDYKMQGQSVLEERSATQTEVPTVQIERMEEVADGFIGGIAHL